MVARTAKRRLGFEVYDILSGTGEETSEDDMAQSIANAFNEAKGKIDRAVENERNADKTNSTA